MINRDVLIVGGGPAGAAAAIHLARARREVTLIEQSSAPHHKICGEFLSREALKYINDLNVNLHALGAVPIHAVRLIAKREIAACDLPFQALSLTRRTLDESLLGLATQAGAEVQRGQRVNALEVTNAGCVARLSWGAVLAARTAFLAVGKHDLNSQRRSRGFQNNLVAFKMYFHLRVAQIRALQGFVELYLFPGGYAGLQLVEENQANLCLVVTRTMLRRCGNQWPALLNHLRASSDALARRLDGAEPLLEKPLALSAIPYGMIRKTAPVNLWTLGDQAAVIPSFSGDGISIALHSGHLAADHYIRNASAAEFSACLHREVRNSVLFAAALSGLMVAAPALAHAARMWPPLLSLIAARTRIPNDVLIPSYS